MADPDRPTLNPRWDLALVPADEAVDRGLLLDIHAPQDETVETRRPVNLVLVLDRSGSMEGPPMAAVIEAACGVVDGMDGRDRLAIVAFDHEVDVVVPPMAMDAPGREAAHRGIRRLHARGSTDLASGWYRGAECASAMCETGGDGHAHVVILSDGRANRGLRDPLELAEHACALAGMGVTTSAVGVGDRYSPNELEALASGGEGRLNHCDSSEDIIDVILGELIDERETIAEQLTLTVRHSRGLELSLLSELPHDWMTGELRVRIGNLRRGATRSVALLATTPELELDALAGFEFELAWRDVRTGADQRTAPVRARLRAASEEAVEAAPRDLHVAERILDLWEASLAYRASQFHAEGDFERAFTTITSMEDRIQFFARGTQRITERKEARTRLGRSVSRMDWDPNASRTVMDVSRKALRQDVDRRRDSKGEWWGSV